MKWHFIIILFLLVFVSGCTKTVIVPEEQAEDMTEEEAEVAEEEEVKETGEEVETKTTLREVKCGDDYCANREHLSDTKKLTCGADLSFCNIEIDGKMTATENFYTCPKDCTDKCSVSFSVSVCEAGSGRFKIRVTGEDLYNYSMLFEGAELSMISYGRYIGEQFTWDAGPFIRIAGSVNKIYFMPKVMKNGKVIDCSNEEIIVDDLKNC